MTIKAGDTVWVLTRDNHRLASYRDGDAARVAKVGRKWITLDNGMRLAVGSVLPSETVMGQNDVGLSYDVFASQEDLEAFKTRKAECSRVWRLLHSDRFLMALPKADIEDLRALDAAIERICATDT